MSVDLDGDLLLAHLDELAASARRPGTPGVTRLAWSAADVAARELLAGWVGAPGVTVTTDAVGNLTADWPGHGQDLNRLVTGSHLDTVTNGGPLDGAYGTVAAFEVIAALAAAGERLRHPIRAVAWANEEGVVAPPFTGSRAATGQAIELDAVGPDGMSLTERLVAGGGDGAAVAGATWPPIAGYLELHIEQGPVLDELRVPIGAVTAIAGCRRGQIVVTGRANHAGTTPMHLRLDALAAAAPLVTRIGELASDGPADVATVGALTVEPGNTNVIPERVRLSYDIRSSDDGACDEAFEMLRVAANGVAAMTGITVAVSVLATSAAVPTSPIMRTAVAEAATSLGLASVELASGAGHDAQHLAALGPMGMIFVPSAGGLSHNPAETTAPEHLVAGARTLLAAIRLADQRLE